MKLLAINNSLRRQIKAFDRSDNRAPSFRSYLNNSFNFKSLLINIDMNYDLA